MDTNVVTEDFWTKKMDEILVKERKNGLKKLRLFLFDGGDETVTNEVIAEDFCKMYESIEWDRIVVTPQ